jgi:hypothetical protein
MGGPILTSRRQLQPVTNHDSPEEQGAAYSSTPGMFSPRVRKSDANSGELLMNAREKMELRGTDGCGSCALSWYEDPMMAIMPPTEKQLGDDFSLSERPRARWHLHVDLC